MTRTAKLDAPTIPLDRPAPALRGSAEGRAPSAADAAEPQPIDSELLAELESALQAVFARGSRLESAEPVQEDAAPADNHPQDEHAQEEAAEYLQDEAPHAASAEPDSGAAQPSTPPNTLVRLAATQSPERAPAIDLEPTAFEYRPGPEPRRQTLPLRAALCVAGVLGLVGAGGLGLMLAAAPEDSEAPLLAKPVRTETIHAPVAADSQPAPVEEASEPLTPTRAAAAAADAPATETPATEFTLLRPVGEGRSTAASIRPVDRSPLVQEQPRAGVAGAGETAKAPDRLVAPPAQETVTGEPGEPAAESLMPVVPPAAQPAEGSTERLPGRAEPAAGEEIAAPAPTPLVAEELVAGTGVEEPASGAAGAQEMATPQETPSSAAGGDEGAAQAEAAGSAPTRSAPVTSAVNMRAGPNNDAAVLTVVPAGSQVEVIACEHWCEVVFSGERGWIYKSFVRGADS